MRMDVEKRRRWFKAAVVPVIGILLLLAALPWILQGSGGDADANVPNPPVTPTEWIITIDSGSVHVDAPLLGIDTSPQLTLDPPRDPKTVGWWSKSNRPGDKVGLTVVTGHTVHTGGGQFDHIGEIQPGAAIVITSTTGDTFAYKESDVKVLSKEQVDQQHTQLFTPNLKHRNQVVLITCGDWDGKAYHTNVFVYADLVTINGKPIAPASGASA